jgi:hypothetical protein
MAYTVRRDGDRDLCFEGELIASISSRRHEGKANTRWNELALYRTAGGKLVASKIGRTIWQGEVDRYEAVVGDERVISSFFGYSDAAKELYEKAGIDALERIE